MGDWARDAAELDRRLGRTPPAAPVAAAPEVVPESAPVDGAKGGWAVVLRNSWDPDWGAMPHLRTLAPAAPPATSVAASWRGWDRPTAAGGDGSWGVAPMVQPEMKQYGAVSCRDLRQEAGPPYSWSRVSADWFRHLFETMPGGLFNTVPQGPPDPIPPGAVVVTDFDAANGRITVDRDGKTTTFASDDSPPAAGAWRATLGPSPLRRVYEIYSRTRVLLAAAMKFAAIYSPSVHADRAARLRSYAAVDVERTRNLFAASSAPAPPGPDPVPVNGLLIYGSMRQRGAAEAAGGQ